MQELHRIDAGEAGSVQERGIPAGAVRMTHRCHEGDRERWALHAVEWIERLSYRAHHPGTVVALRLFFLLETPCLLTERLARNGSLVSQRPA